MLRLLPLLALLGCATVQDALERKADGTSEIYAVSGEDAWEIARKVFRWEGTDAIQYDRPAGLMITSTDDTVMACWIEPVEEGRTRVTVVTKRRYQLSLFTSLTETTFHRRFRQGMEMLESGPLPLLAPPYETRTPRG